MHNAGKVYSLNETQIEIFMLQKLNDDRSLLVNQEQYTFNLLFDEKKLGKCVEDVVISNPILRSVVREKNNIPVQIVMDKMQNSFSYVYCDNIDDLCDAEVRKVSEINTNTMFSILVIASSKQTSEFNYILWVISHAIADGYSLSLLERELEKSITDESYELRFDDKEEKNEVIQPEFMNSSIELSIDYSTMVENRVTKRFMILPRKKGVQKEQLIYSIVKMISSELNEDIFFSTLINQRIKYNMNYNVVRDMHDEVVYCYKKGEDDINAYKEAMHKQKGIVELQCLNNYIPFQFNYEIEDFQIKEAYSEGVTSIVNKVFDDFENRIYDKIMSINISDNLEKLNIEIVSTLKEDILDKIIGRMENIYE